MVVEPGHRQIAGQIEQGEVVGILGPNGSGKEMLAETVHRSFHERQVYRIDHYLGKETVQNILVFRFANGIFEPVWNRRYIDHVQITVAETVGVEDRGNYYEKAGVLRDMVHNHMFQLLSLIAMEPPVELTVNTTGPPAE